MPEYTGNFTTWEEGKSDATEDFNGGWIDKDTTPEYLAGHLPFMIDCTDEYIKGYTFQAMKLLGKVIA